MSQSTTSVFYLRLIAVTHTNGLLQVPVSSQVSKVMTLLRTREGDALECISGLEHFAVKAWVC